MIITTSEAFKVAKYFMFTTVPDSAFKYPLEKAKSVYLCMLLPTKHTFLWYRSDILIILCIRRIREENVEKIHLPGAFSIISDKGSSRMSSEGVTPGISA